MHEELLVDPADPSQTESKFPDDCAISRSCDVRPPSIEFRPMRQAWTSGEVMILVVRARSIPNARRTSITAKQVLLLYPKDTIMPSSHHFSHHLVLQTVFHALLINEASAQRPQRVLIVRHLLKRGRISRAALSRIFSMGITNDRPWPVS